MIDIQHLTRRFGALTAVDDLSFSVEEGESFALLGPNGAGKTTTIHMVTGALRPDSGSISVAGQSDPTRAPVRRQLGLAPQSLALYDRLTARENLAFFGKIQGLGGGALRERVEWGLDFAQLTDRADDRTETFSGGMKRRLNLAVALVHRPRAVLLDEPTAGVDPQSRLHIFEGIERLRREGLTVVLTTHMMEEAERLCDRIAIMDHGKLLALGSLADLTRAHGGTSRVEVVFETLPPEAAALPAALDGNTLTFESTEPMREVAALAGHGGTVRTLHVLRPNLEEVFLNLTGRRLRDE